MKKPKEVALLLLYTGALSPVFPVYIPAVLAGFLIIFLLLISCNRLSAALRQQPTGTPACVVTPLKWKLV
ncbi:hypothetical protein [Aridibaculum aurantiacum]|uniref:hypothetical protein n=1 Tax=Aridibaculum aurantiacum TaxID=2810307 RepID=UPI001A96320A|nr:hypothetical protein [Aridibaculum aurantiacum]